MSINGEALRPDQRFEVGDEVIIQFRHGITEVHGASGRPWYTGIGGSPLHGERDPLITVTGRYDGMVDFDTTKDLDLGNIPGKGGILSDCVTVTGTSEVNKLPQQYIVPWRVSGIERADS